MGNSSWMVRAGPGAAWTDAFIERGIVAVGQFDIVWAGLELSAAELKRRAAAELRGLLLEHYDALDPQAKALVPLRRLYWPAD